MKKTIKVNGDDQLIGLTVKQGEKKGYTIRVIREDGVTYVGTMDYNPSRINVELKDKKIIRISGRG